MEIKEEWNKQKEWGIHPLYKTSFLTRLHGRDFGGKLQNRDKQILTGIKTGKDGQQKDTVLFDITYTYFIPDKSMYLQLEMNRYMLLTFNEPYEFAEKLDDEGVFYLLNPFTFCVKSLISIYNNEKWVAPIIKDVVIPLITLEECEKILKSSFVMPDNFRQN